MEREAHVYVYKQIRARSYIRCDRHHGAHYGELFRREYCGRLPLRCGGPRVGQTRIGKFSVADHLAIVRPAEWWHDESAAPAIAGKNFDRGRPLPLLIGVAARRER